MAKQDVRVDLFYDGAWQPQLNAVYTRDEIQISRPRGERQTEPVTSTASLTFGNGTETNPYNPNNPSSALYGKIGLNTPLRIVLGGETTEDFEDASLNLTITGTWARSNADAHGGTWSLKSGTITHGQISEAVITVPAGATSMSMWYRTSSEEGFDYLAVYIGERLVLAASGEGEWTHVMLDVAGQTQVLLQYQKDGSDSAFDDAVYVDDIVFDDIRYAGEASSWQPRRAIKGDAWTLVTANGVLHRLEQGTPPLRSPLHRAHTLAGPVAWWHLEDARDSDTAASGVTGVAPMEIVDKPPGLYLGGGNPDGSTEFGVTGSGGAATLAGLQNGGFLRGRTPVVNSTTWRFEFVARFDAGTDAGLSTVIGSMRSGNYEWSIEYNAGEQVRAIGGTIDGSVVGFLIGSGAGTFDAYDGRLHNYRLEATQDGADVDFSLALDGEEVATGTWSAFTLPVGVYDVLVNYFRAAGEDMPSVGHYALYAPIPAASTTVAATDGHAGETAGARLRRLSAELDIPFSMPIGVEVDTEPMGPQPTDTDTALLAECERTDGGILSETRYEVGLTYRPRVHLYNQTAALTLDYEAGQISALEPDIGNTNVRNDVTVSRRNGSDARAVQETGPNNVQRPQDDPQGVGRYEAQIDVNPYLDSALPGHATWHLGIGTTPDTRYTATVELTAGGALAVDASAVRAGDLFTIDQLPEDPDQATQLALGFEEVIGSHTRQITVTGAPAAPYRVFVLGTSRLAASGSTLTNAETSSSTAWELTTPAGSAVWSTTDDPYDLAAAGERVTVTTAADTTSPQDVTVTRSVNGVVKAQAAGAAVQIFQPHVLAL